MNSLKYTVFGDTHIGLIRKTNEDSFLVNQEKNLFAIADGLGGLPMGALASKTAIDTLNSINYENTLNFPKAFDQINDVINSIGKKIDINFGIATTLTAIQIHNNTLHGGHIGDTGIFLFKKDSWTKLTQDHTMAEQIKADANDNENLTIPNYYYNILTQCIGKGNTLNIQTFQQLLEPDDRILLYSDGVTLNLSPQELHLLAFLSNSPETFVKTIIQQANDRGGSDNITAIAIFIQ